MSMRTAITLCLVTMLPLVTSACDAVSPNDAKKRAEELEEPRYDEASITAIVLEKVNFTNQARESWDVNSGPDLFFGLFRGSRQVVTGNTRVNVKRSGLPLRWDIDHKVKALGQGYSVGFADADADDADQIGGSRYTFTMMEAHRRGFLETISFSGRNGVEARVEIEWSKSKK